MHYQNPSWNSLKVSSLQPTLSNPICILAFIIERKIIIDYSSFFQLLAQTIQHEKPELEVRKTDLLKTEEDLKIQLAKLEESLLEELANAKGGLWAVLLGYQLL